MRMLRWTAVLALAFAAPAAAQEAGRQAPQTFEKQIVKNIRLNYLLYLPEDYGKEAGKKWPLLLFLHGAGERGSDIEKVKVHGPPKLIAAGKSMPFIVASPQCPEGSWWTPEPLKALLDDLMARYAVDPDRVYCTGLSMGGFGTWSLATEYPALFAAIAPICGGGQPFMTRRITHVAVWVFHGAKDPVVPVRLSQEMVDALKAAGGNVKLTIYPEANHDSWTETYNNPEFYAWLLAQKRTPRQGG